MRSLAFAFVIVALGGGASSANMSNVVGETGAGVQSLYAQGTATVTTSSTKPALIPAMQLTLPPKSSDTAYALVTFDGPNVTEDALFCVFGIYAGSTRFASGRSPLLANAEGAPITLVTKIPLGSSATPLQVAWHVLHGYNSCTLLYFYSLSVILTAK